MRTAGTVVRLVITAVVARRLMIHVIRIVATSTIYGPRRGAVLVCRALSIRAFIHHSVVIVIHLRK